MSNLAIELSNVSRRINSEFYIKNVSLSLPKSHTLALIGKNASGKSSLFRLISGSIIPDEGQIFIDGLAVSFSSPADAVASHIFTLQQNSKGFPGLAVYENVYFGREIYLPHIKIINTKQMLLNCTELFSQMGLNIDPKIKMKDLSFSEVQLVNLASAILSEAKVILLDEPSVALSPKEKTFLYRAINGLKKIGVSFILISHDIDEVLSVADSVVVLERGKITQHLPINQIDFSWLVFQMSGFSIEDIYHKPNIKISDPVLQINSKSRNVDFSVSGGEIVSIYGDSFSKVESPLLAAAGYPSDDWLVSIKNVPINNSVDALRLGVSVAYMQSWKRRHALLTKASGKFKNSSLASFATDCSETFSLIGECFQNVIGSQDINCASGGFIHQELVSYALSQPANVFLLYNPSAGLDVLAKMELYENIFRLASKGAAFLICSFSPDEIVGLSDKVIVLKNLSLAVSLSKQNNNLSKKHLMDILELPQGSL